MTPPHRRSDVRAGGAVVLAGVTNPNEGVLNIPAGTVSADVVLAGTYDRRHRAGRLWILPRAARRSCMPSVAPRMARWPWSPSPSRACIPPPAACPPAPGRPTARLPGIALVVLLTLGMALAVIGGRRLYLDRSH